MSQSGSIGLDTSLLHSCVLRRVVSLRHAMYTNAKHGLTNRQTDRQTDRERDRQTNKQTKTNKNKKLLTVY